MKNLIFCLDVDGTIVAREGDFYEGAELMCQKLNELDWNVVLCSARPIQSLITMSDKLCGINWVCGLGGAVIAHRAADKITGSVHGWEIRHHSPFIDNDAVVSIIKWAESNDFQNIWAYDSMQWYVTRETDRVKRETFITGLNPTFCTADYIENKSLLKLVFPHVPEELMESLKKCAASNGLFANYSTDTQVEINTPISHDKGIGVLKILVFGNAKSIVASLGDGANDSGMLSASDMPFTFSDAHPSLQAIAKYTLSDNREAAYRRIIDLVELSTF